MGWLLGSILGGRFEESHNDDNLEWSLGNLEKKKIKLSSIKIINR